MKIKNFFFFSPKHNVPATEGDWNPHLHFKNSTESQFSVRGSQSRFTFATVAWYQEPKEVTTGAFYCGVDDKKKRTRSWNANRWIALNQSRSSGLFNVIFRMVSLIKTVQTTLWKSFDFPENEVTATKEPSRQLLPFSCGIVFCRWFSRASVNGRVRIVFTIFWLV